MFRAMRFLIFLSFLLGTTATFAEELRCEDILTQPSSKSYFSLLLQSAGGEFVTEAETVGLPTFPWRDGIPELIPFEDPRMDEIAIRMRAVLMDFAFSGYRQGRWENFAAKFLNESKRFEMETGYTIWAALTLSAIRGDLSLAEEWIKDHLRQGWLYLRPASRATELALIKFALTNQMLIYQAADEVHQLVLEWESENPLAPADEKVLSWNLLRMALSSEELFLVKQALVWEPRRVQSREGQNPESLRAAMGQLFYELSRETLRDETLSLMEQYLSYPMSEEDQILFTDSLQGWLDVLSWLRSHKHSASQIVRDVLEFRKFYPEVR